MKSINRQLGLSWRRQQGNVLVVTALFMLVLMGASTHFYYRATASTTLAGSARDNAESLLLAESALNMMLGRFSSGLDSDGDGTTDKIEGGVIQQNMTNPAGLLMPYMYYVTAGAGIDQTQPSLLQRVADGESLGSVVGGLAGQDVSSASNVLRVNALFGAGFSPQLYTLNNNSLLIDSAAADWDSETNASKAAAWFELAQNPNDSAALDLYVQAVAAVGDSKSYVQRYVGTYYANIAIGSIAILAEASNLNRSGP